MSNKSLKGIDYEIARNCKYDEYQRALVFYKNRGSGVSLNEWVSEWVSEWVNVWVSDLAA